MNEDALPPGCAPARARLTKIIPALLGTGARHPNYPEQCWQENTLGRSFETLLETWRKGFRPVPILVDIMIPPEQRLAGIDHGKETKMLDYKVAYKTADHPEAKEWHIGSFANKEDALAYANGFTPLREHAGSKPFSLEDSNGTLPDYSLVELTPTFEPSTYYPLFTG